MQIPRAPHNWSVTPRQAVTIQKELASAVVRHLTGQRQIRFVAGVDAAFSPDGAHYLAGVVVWDAEDQVVVEQHLACRRLVFPYIPGLLTFREAPAIIAALRKLQRPPDVLLCDGQGIAHPRRLGIASHLGLLTGLPAIGCAKSRLIGAFREPAPQKGGTSPLLDGDERIGSVVRTREGVKCVFVSIGHRIDLPTAEQLVLACAIRYRLPEPTRLADQLVGAARRHGMGAG
ncbi:MAG: deoxyribonuclease V [Desulfobulbaceae bacterium]|nr:deoxyribonuclease V [Desulfobulbaceae bacterium]